MVGYVHPLMESHKNLIHEAHRKLVGRTVSIEFHTNYICSLSDLLCSTLKPQRAYEYASFCTGIQHAPCQPTNTFLGLLRRCISTALDNDESFTSFTHSPSIDSPSRARLLPLHSLLSFY